MTYAAVCHECRKTFIKQVGDTNKFCFECRQGPQEMVEVIEHWRKNKDGEIVHYECFEGPKND